MIDFGEAWLPTTLILFVGCSQAQEPAAARHPVDADPKSAREAPPQDEGAAPGLDLTFSDHGVFVHASGDDAASAWTAVLRRNAGGLTRCFRDFTDSVLACRNSGVGDVHVTYQVWARDAPPSKFEYGAHPRLEYAPLSGSSDPCADDYERSEDLGKCMLAALGEGVEDFSPAPVRLLFTNYEGREGTIGVPRD